MIDTAGYFKRVIFRLGFIFALASVIFVIGKIYNVISPPEASANEQIPLAVGGLAAPLSDPEMALALSQLQSDGSLGGGALPGAKLTFPSPEGPVTLTTEDLGLLNARYRQIVALRPAVPDNGAEARREAAAADGWGGDASY